jgi:hypothetical protein
MVIDHIDGDRSNHKLSNLQCITHTENVTKSKKNKTGFTGVSKMGNRYTSRPYVNGKGIALGCFDTPEEAHKAYVDFVSKIKNGVV